MLDTGSTTEGQGKEGGLGRRREEAERMVLGGLQRAPVVRVCHFSSTFFLLWTPGVPLILFVP